MDDNRIITGTRWFFDGSLVLTEDDSNRENTDPYYINTTPTTLYIDMPFSHSGTYTCSPNNMFPAIPPGDTVTLNARSEHGAIKLYCCYCVTDNDIQPYPCSICNYIVTSICVPVRKTGLFQNL